MLKTNLSLSLLLCCTMIGLGQTQSVDLKGAITNTTDVEGIHILNTTSKFNTISNETGHFSIQARLHDTLVVSSIRYMPQQVVVNTEVYESATIIITLEELVNELEEVVLAPNLSGDLERDLKNIKIEKKLNFYDVGLPGFTGTPQEKIVPAYTLAAPTAVDIEAIYKHLSGYYKKLKIQRQWQSENNTVAYILNTYTRGFFDEAYGIPENRVYDFLLFCIETTGLQQAYKKHNYVAVIAIFDEKSTEYVARLATSEEATKKEE